MIKSYYFKISGKFIISFCWKADVKEDNTEDIFSFVNEGDN
jgi:hypothetical protein